MQTSITPNNQEKTDQATARVKDYLTGWSRTPEGVDTLAQFDDWHAVAQALIVEQARERAKRFLELLDQEALALVAAGKINPSEIAKQI